MENFYRSTAVKPYHLSVGAVVINKNREVLCHHFSEFAGEKYDAYILMRETIHHGESLEDAVQRGIMEEFGAKGKIIAYIGSTLGTLMRGEVPTEKTTLYFLVEYENHDLSLRSEEDIENGSTVEWQSPDFLLERFKKQSDKFNRSTLDESKVLAGALAIKF
jgi:hypothetical protein